MSHYTEKVMNRTANPGDRIAENDQTIEEKAKQIAVDAPDITGDHIRVPTYFIVEYPDGVKRALHHVKDAKAISDVLRQLDLNESESGEQSLEIAHFFNLSAIALLLGLLLITVPILLGIF